MLRIHGNRFSIPCNKVLCLFNRLIAPQFGLPVDERSLREGGEWLARYLPVVNDRLGASPYLGGDAITLADISLLVNVERAGECGVSLEPYPNLTRGHLTSPGVG